jgi:molybdate transport system ATP-binding protein
VCAITIDYTLNKPVPLRAQLTVQGFTVLLGRSGVGKTSLLRAVAGLLPAMGTPWQGLAPEQRPIGYLPQETLLFPHLSVLDNTAYALRGADRRQRATALLEELGLEALASRYPHELSGGQAKRVALARALAHGTELLLLDEPAAGLDSVTRDAMLDWLIETTACRNVPVLAATHDHEVAIRADRLVLLAEGQIIQEGPVRTVMEALSNRAAAELLGYENIYEQEGVLWALRAAAILPDAAGEPFKVISARVTAMGLRLVCEAEQRLVVDLPNGQLEDYPPGSILRLNLSARTWLG